MSAQREIEKALKEFDKELTEANKRASNYYELLKITYEEFVRPVLIKKINEKPYRIRAIVKEEDAPNWGREHKKETSEFTEIIYILEQQQLGFDPVSKTVNGKFVETYDTHWQFIGRFKSGSLADKAAKELMSSSTEERVT